MRNTAYTFGVLVLLLVPGITAQSAIVETTGAVTVTAPPPSLVLGQWESDTEIRIFVERTNFALPIALDVDVTLPGTVPGTDDENLSEGTIPAGTFVDSYFVHVDSISGGSGNQIAYAGSVTFNQAIIGVLLKLTESDSDEYLGFPGTIYSTGNNRNLELDPSEIGTSFHDSIILSDDLRTITFDIRNGRSLDQLRVITAVPEASSIILCASATLAIGAFCLRQRITRRS